MAETTSIPEPPRYPLIGNLAEFSGTPLQDLVRLADTYGPIFRIHLGSRSVVVCGSNEFINEICNEKRFHKSLKSVLRLVREGAHDGLFTAYDNEPNWSKAHRILVPAFGPLSIRGMFDEMHDIASQLALKFARHGPDTPINVSDDFTRLALDTIALCAMDFRFNSFYRESQHDFVQAMGDFLTECQRRQNRPPFAPGFLYRGANEKFERDVALMKRVADEVIQARRRNPGERKDLLAAMLNGVDPQTKEKLSDENITNQLITFLIAGHETTSGLLSFSFYQLLKHPAAYQRVQEEVDRVVGQGPVKVEHLSKLPYISGVLREVLRLCSPISAFGVEAYEDTLLGGKYPVRKGEVITAFLAKGHLDPVVYGEDASEFRPERMMDEEFARLSKEFPNCWKPFGNGKRACIGRPFAWQEALLAIVVLFQNFEFSMDDANYQLELQQALTIKPKHFRMRARLRHGLTPTELERRLAGKAASHPEASKPVAAAEPPKAAGKPIAVYYGSNSGTCEALAQRLAADAPSHGFNVSPLAPLDAAKEKLSPDRPVVIVTASYEGQPPSNAAHFVTWMEGLKGQELKGVEYAVFGCGHHDWATTFHRIPKLVDATLEKRGGQRLVEMGSADAAASDMFSDFETWEDETLWPALKEKYNTSSTPSTPGPLSSILVDITTPRKATLRQDVEEALVLSTATLTASGPAKNHIEIQLPSGMTYRAGDYLAVLPLNPKETVARVFRRFQLAWDSYLKISCERPTTLPTGVEISAFDVLSGYVELRQPATRRNILALIEATEDKEAIEQLQKLAGEDYQAEVSAKKVCVLDLLEQFPSIALPIGSYLALLPPLRVRQYSISSSPLADPSKLTLTYSLLEAPSLSDATRRHIGVATHFLASLSPGEKLHVAVRPAAAPFHLPRNPETTPLIFIAAGSGLAPFRGFIQERAAMLAAGRTLAPALLFFGCRSPAVDDLYAAEFERWETLGAVSVRRAYSRAVEESKGCKYVQDRLWHDAEDVYALWDRGAKFYICGSRDVGKAVDEVCIRLIARRTLEKEGKAVDEKQAREWFEKQRNERFATDVFD